MVFGIGDLGLIANVENGVWGKEKGREGRGGERHLKCGIDFQSSVLGRSIGFDFHNCGKIFGF